MYACDNCGCLVPVRTLPYTLCDVCENKDLVEHVAPLPEGQPWDGQGDDEHYGSWEEYCADCDEQDALARSYYDEELSANEYFEG